MAKLYFKVEADYEKVIKLRDEIARLKSELLSMDKNTSPQVVRELETSLSSASREMCGLTQSAAMAGASIEGDLKKRIFDTSQVSNDLTAKMIQQRKVIKDVELDVRKLSDAYHAALKAGQHSKASTMLSELTASKEALAEEKRALFDLSMQQSEARLTTKRLKDEMALFKDETKETTEANDEMGLSFTKMFAVIGGAAAVKSLISNIIQVRSEFRRVEVGLETMLGKAKAATLLGEIRDYAAESPLDLKGISSATQTMIGFNIEAEKTPRFIRAIGDVSQGDAGRFQSLTLAFSQMSATGKLMGQDLNQMINAGFNPLSTMAETTGKSISVLKDEMSKGAISAEMVQQAFIDATSEGGKFFNMSQNASKELAGQMSMMQDAIDNALNDMGTKTEGVMMSGIQLTTELIKNYETVGKVLVGLVATYGAYRAAVIAVSLAEKIRYQSTLMQMAGMTKMQAITDILRAKTALLNKTMLANPYVAVAAGVAALVSAMWVLNGASTDAEKANSRLNNAIKEAEKSSTGETRELAKLKGSLDAAKKGSEEYSKIKNEIVSKYGAYRDGLSEEIDKIGLLDSTYKSLTESIQASFSARQYESFKKTEYSKLDDTMSENLGKIQDRLIEKLGDEAGAKYYAKIRDAIFNGNVSVDALHRTSGLDKDTESALKKASKTSIFGISDFAIEGYIRKITTAQELTDELDKKARIKFGVSSDKKEVVSTNTVEDSVEEAKNKEYWEKQKKEAQSKLDALTDIEAAGKEGAKIKAEIEKYDEKINSYSLNKKAGEKNNDDKLKSEEKINNELLALKKQSQQAEIDLMAEGSAKKIAQIELNYKSEIERLKKLEKEWMEAQGGKLTSDQSVSLSVSYSSADSLREKGLSDVGKADNESLKELLNQYQDYAAKRLSIKEQYTKDIQKLEKQRTDANASEIDRAVAVANESMKNAIQSLDMEELQKEIDWSLVFGNLSRVPTEGLSDLKKKLQDFIATNNELSPENLQAVVEAIDKITTEQTERDPFSSLAASFQAMKDANALLKESQEEYTKALEEGTAEELKNAKAKLENAKAGKQKAQSDATESLQASVDRMGEFKDVADGVLGVLQSFGMEVPDWLGGAMGGIDDIISGLGEIDLTKPMSVITGGLKALSGAVNTIASLGGIIPGMGESDKSLAKDIERLSQSNNDLKKAIDNLSEKMEKSSVAEATGTYNEQKALLEQSIANTKEMMQREGAAYKGGIGGSHSSNYKIDKNMGASDWARISSIVGKSVNSAGDFWNLTSEEMAKVATEATDLYSKIKDYADDGYKNAGQYMDAYIEYYKELEELENQWRGKLTSSSFDTIRSDFKSALMDMESDAETFADNFENLMKNAMLESMMSETYNQELQNWYKNFSKSMEDGTLSSSEQGDLKTEWDKIVQNALDERNAMFEVMGWDSASTSSQDQGSSKAYSTMSQDEGEEMNGRLTALQITGEEIRNQAEMQTVKLDILCITSEEIRKFVSGISDISNEIRDMLASIFLEVVEIRENTGLAAKYLKSIQSDISEVKQNTSKL